MNNNINNVKPSQLGISGVSYQHIFDGKINRSVPMPLHQQGMLKAFQEICVEEGKDNFIPVTPKKILKKLQTTVIAPFIPAGDIYVDVVVMVNRGWFMKKDGDQITLTDYAKEILLNIKN